MLNIGEVYDAVASTKDKELKQLVTSLCDYVPYRLLAYLWQQELKGKSDGQKNNKNKLTKLSKRIIMKTRNMLWNFVKTVIKIMDYRGENIYV